MIKLSKRNSLQLIKLNKSTKSAKEKQKILNKDFD